MKRLLKIAFDIALLSFIPVISWFVLGLIVDANLINVFTLTYPIQFIWYILKSIFSTGTNISKKKDNNPNSVMSGIVIGSIVGLVVFGLFVLNIDLYISFMNMDVSIYHEFALYSVIQLYIQLIFSFILNKLYYENKNDEANKYSIGFNLLNFVVVVGTALIFKDKMVIVIITLVAIALYVIFMAFKTFEKFKLKFVIIRSIRYDSVELCSNIFFFLTYLFGLSVALNFGPKYALALTFVALITDTQWDSFDAIAVSSQVDICDNKFNYKEHFKNAYKLCGILLFTTLIMFGALFWFYDLNIWITLIFLGIEVVAMILYPLYRIKTSYLQIEYSGVLPAVNKIVGSGLRTTFSFVPTPYCTGIGQIFSGVYQTITINLMFNKNYKIELNGKIKKIED